MSLRGTSDRLSPADLVTILNAVLGFLAVALLVRHWASRPDGIADGIQVGELKLAGALIGCGALCDAVDGLVARATWTSGLGDHLDNMADAVTFGVAPALLVAVAGLGFPSPFDALALAAASTHVVAVVVRLARNAAAPHAPSDGFVGLPAPIGAIAVIAVIALELGPAVTVAGVFGVSAMMLAGFRYPHQSRPVAMAVVVAFAGCGIGVMTGLVSLRLASVLGLLAIVVLPLVVPATASAPRRRARVRLRRGPARAKAL